MPSAGPGHARVSRCSPAQQVKSGPSRGAGNFETSRDARHISSCECALCASDEGNNSFEPINSSLL